MATSICNCNTLRAWARERGTPVKYDPDLNEFQLTCRSGYKIFWYCPFCGKSVPRSRRPSLGADVLNEGEKIRGRLSGLRTRAALVQRFGVPDQEDPTATTFYRRYNSNGKPELISKRRGLTYRSISKKFDVTFFVGRHNERIALNLQPKDRPRRSRGRLG